MIESSLNQRKLQSKNIWQNIKNMLINRDLIFQNVTSNALETREFVMIESIINSISMIESSYQFLVNLIENKTFEQSNEVQLSMIKEVWNIIDSSNRMRCLLDKLPNIKKKEPWFNLMLRTLKEAEKLRHYIQHYDQEIETILSNVRPLLGHLSWVEYVDDKTMNVKLLVPGYLRNYKGLNCVNPTGKSIQSKVDMITYFIGNHEISISMLCLNLSDFTLNFESHVSNRVNEIGA